MKRLDCVRQVVVVVKAREALKKALAAKGNLPDAAEARKVLTGLG